MPLLPKSLNDCSNDIPTLKMKCIYWNTRNMTTLDWVIDLINQEHPEFFFLSEISEETIESEQDKINEIGYQYFPNPGCERVKIICKQDISVELGLQTRYYTAIKTESEINLIAVHLPSLMFQNFDSLKEFIRDFRTNIDAEIGTSLDERILIIGDFNVNPFEKPMIDFDGFLASNSTNSRPEITHLGKTKQLYFNPTWQLYNRVHFPGTKHFKRPTGSSYDILEFHYLDQVVISQKLKVDKSDDQIYVIEETDKFDYLNKTKNTIQNSDHLPLIYNITLKI